MAQNVLTFQERQLNAGASVTKSVINIPKAWAAVNRKNARHTDAKGYLQTYVCRVEIQSTDVLSYLYTAPETWVLKNGVRKWHAARNKWLASMGQLDKVGEYHKTIRPYLHKDHQTSDNTAAFYELVPLKQGATMDMGEWTYTSVSAPSSIDNTDSNADYAGGDVFELVLAGTHDNGAGTDSSGTRRYTKVSIMQSYLESRRNQIGSDLNDDAADSLQPEPSPLIGFMSHAVDYQGAAEVVAEYQEERSPYSDPGTGTWNAATDAHSLQQAGLLRTTEQYGRDSAIIRVPGGIFSIWNQNQHASAARLPQIQVEVLGITRAEG